MDTVDIHEAKTHPSRLIERVAKGDAVVIAKAGKRVAKLAPFNAQDAPARCLGFLIGEIETPADFDHMRDTAIEALFSGEA
jgi:prevent-host-death family protein